MISDKWGIRWDSYIFGLVYLASTQSKDQSTNLGAVIVDKNKYIRSIAYNSFPAGINDNLQARQERPEKYYFFSHAERNAVFAAARIGVSVDSCIMYTQGFPCPDCAHSIIQSGIVELVLDSQWDAQVSETMEEQGINWEDVHHRSVAMFREAGVAVRLYKGPIRQVTSKKRNVVIDHRFN